MLAVGEYVLTLRGTGMLVDVYQMNYLPRFRIKDYLTGKMYTTGKSKIRGKFVPDTVQTCQVLTRSQATALFRNQSDMPPTSGTR